ncbi:MAG: cytidine deaminase [Candidatus Marinimicrobia bacterium]|jgi:cytidine deaminase|nr:cytidine deaminase [Candidatus Neomarinimicrobiota bacterium]
MNELINKAIQMMDRSRAPYSNYKVGAAVETADGNIIGGCNVENASYPLSNCAERTALFTAVAEGYSQFKAMAVSTENGGAPCGACRQVIWELCGDIPIYICNENGLDHEITSSTLLPEPFDESKLT